MGVTHTVDYDPTYLWDESHFYGQSISQLEVLCHRHDYAIVELEYNNAFVMPTELAPRSLSAREAYRRGYVEREDRKARFPWNADMEALQQLSPDRAVDFLRARFEKYEGRYLLERGD